MGMADVYIDVLTDEAVRTGLQLKGNCTAFSIKGESERVEEEGTGLSNYGQIIASAVFPKPSSASSEFSQFDPDLFAMAFFGTNTALTQSAGTLSAVNFTALRDKFVECGKLNISSVVLTHSSGTPTYVANTDYTVVPALGMIRANTGGAIANNQVCRLSCSYALVNGSEMEGMTKSNVRARILLHGQNHADGRIFKLDVFQARFSPSNEYGFIATDKKFMRAKFDMTLETPAGGTAPYKLTWLS